MGVSIKKARSYYYFFISFYYIIFLSFFSYLVSWTHSKSHLNFDNIQPALISLSSSLSLSIFYFWPKFSFICSTPKVHLANHRKEKTKISVGWSNQIKIAVKRTGKSLVAIQKKKLTRLKCLLFFCMRVLTLYTISSLRDQGSV